jgi:hypothetical protein
LSDVEHGHHHLLLLLLSLCIPVLYCDHIEGNASSAGQKGWLCTAAPGWSSTHYIPKVRMENKFLGVARRFH